ncbi:MULTISPECIES: acyl-CoA carboxylase subunit epsilon [Actinoalloteichus]|uniref:Acyl-CoA carboxylase epsilon subunit n=1 Tax=Actinoalloteichus fjordicus TaxID=1612552 RepID=A0AAC9LIB4_9PSEU|nr:MULTISPECIES: acyl-CoA carboxylase subunit epsilon [Actinoalloteichus]APU17379.1 Acyl-CoA carboxylase epsilon subunit [Actinoalloteichus fjordicus]APU23463.1 Acyl-CoA carboxylase epsilon subunit [Actinoalloteichus sp. GBA129-24]
MTDQQEQPRERPMLRVVRGEPDDVELAALTAVLAAVDTPVREPPKPTRSGWADRAALLRRPLSPGEGAWRRSAF